MLTPLGTDLLLYKSQSQLSLPQFLHPCTTPLLHLSRLSITYPFVIVALGTVVSHTQEALFPKKLYLKMCIVLSHLAWFRASGFFYTMVLY